MEYRTQWLNHYLIEIVAYKIYLLLLKQSKGSYYAIHIFFFFILIERFIVFNTTFSNISAISWQLVLVVEEARVPGENH